MSFIEQARTKGIEELNRKIKVRPMTDFDGPTLFCHRVAQMLFIPLHFALTEHLLPTEQPAGRPQYRHTGPGAQFDRLPLAAEDHRNLRPQRRGKAPGPWEFLRAADLFTKFCVILQILVGAKRRGEQELLAKRERLKLELEKLRRRTDEFPHYSELDMIQQVQ